jgi:transcriptional regulator with XRE-family HTH domain
MSDTFEPDDEVQRLGAYIKEKRIELGLSLRDLAATTGLSATFLSNFERGVANPTLESLRKVSNALNTPILYMTNAPQETSPVVRYGQRRHLNLANGKIHYEILTPTFTKKMVLFEARIVAEDGNVVAGPLAEPTEECLVMLAGRISVRIAEQNYELEAGDSIYFDGGSLESLMAVGDAEARFISAITPPIF